MLGVLPGVIGSLQGTEALKLVLGIGEPLIGRLLLFDALEASFDRGRRPPRPACPVCGDEPTITEYVDYVEFAEALAEGPARDPRRAAGARANGGAERGLWACRAARR